MSFPSFLLILSGVFLNAIAQLLLKKGVTGMGILSIQRADLIPIALKLASQWPILTGLSCYAMSVIIWIFALSRVDVSIAYPMLSLGYIINAFAAWYFLGETLSSARLVGIGIILIGVVVLARG